MSNIIDKFWDFHEANPGVYAMFEKLAHTAIARGRTRLSARLIIERIRWEVYIEVVTEEEFKLPNAYTPFYARKFMLENPQYDGYFITNPSVADYAFEVIEDG